MFIELFDGEGQEGKLAKRNSGFLSNFQDLPAQNY